MAKFGDLIQTDKPVLLDFYTELNPSEIDAILKEVHAFFNGKIKVFKIDIAKNTALTNALRVKGNPTFILFQNGEIKWRQTGFKEPKELIEIINKNL